MDEERADSILWDMVLAGVTGLAIGTWASIGVMLLLDWVR